MTRLSKSPLQQLLVTLLALALAASYLTLATLSRPHNVVAREIRSTCGKSKKAINQLYHKITHRCIKNVLGKL